MYFLNIMICSLVCFIGILWVNFKRLIYYYFGIKLFICIYVMKEINLIFFLMLNIYLSYIFV